MGTVCLSVCVHTCAHGLGRVVRASTRPLPLLLPFTPCDHTLRTATASPRHHRLAHTCTCMHTQVELRSPLCWSRLTRRTDALDRPWRPRAWRHTGPPAPREREPRLVPVPLWRAGRCSDTQGGGLAPGAQALRGPHLRARLLWAPGSLPRLAGRGPAQKVGGCGPGPARGRGQDRVKTSLWLLPLCPPGPELPVGSL